MSRFYYWLLESNHWKHLFSGLLIFGLWYVAFSLIGMDSVLSGTSGLVCVLVAMCSVEYAQKSAGGKWDWSDILAGCLFPFVVEVVLLVSMLL